MTVTPYDHPLRFHVSSDGRDIGHLVDLAENHPLGKCACEQYTFRVQPVVDRARAMGQSVPASMRCKHIEAAREYLLAEVITKLKTNDGGGA